MEAPYVFHNACWKILLCQLRQNNVEISCVLKHLQNMLNDAYWSWGERSIREEIESVGADDESYLQLMYYGRPPIRGLKRTPLRYLFADPLQPMYPGTEGNNTSAQLNSCQPMANVDHDLLDPFATLPTDLIHTILVWLPSSDVRSLALSSRSVFCKSDVWSLPQKFWRSRFEMGFEMEFASILFKEDESFVDWREVFFRTRSALQTRDGYDSLRSLKRIWEAGNALMAVVHLLENSGGMRWPEWSPDEHSPTVWSSAMDNTTSIAHSTADDDLPEDLNDQQNSDDQMSTDTVDSRRQNLQLGRIVKSVYLETGGQKYLAFPPPKCGKAYDIGVSTFSYFGHSYLSGLRILQSDLQSSNTELGLINRASESRLTIGPHDTIQGFEIATRNYGIIAFRIFVNGPLNWVSEWLGGVPENDVHVYVCRSFPRDLGHVAGIAVAFDVSCNIPSMAPTKTI
jgi:hypothetical protein